MNRKKFIKMLMCAGMSRNNAAECAQLAQEAQRPYFKVLGDLLVYHSAKFKQHHVLDDRRVHAAIIHETNSKVYKVLCGTAYIEPQPAAPVVVVPGVACIDWGGIDWTPQPQPVAGFLYAIDESGTMKVTHQGLAKDRESVDALDALTYALEAILNRQREARV